jgi:hypothetical protein
VDGSAMAFPHGERFELTSIGSSPSGEPSAWKEGLAELPLPLEVLTALLMLGWSSTAAVLAASSIGALIASRPGPSGAQGVMSTAAWAMQSCS